MGEALTIPRLGIFETDEQAEFQAECARLTPRQLQRRLRSEYAEEQLLVVQHCEAHQAVREAERRRGALSQACQAQRARIRLLVAEIEERKP
jgi:glutathione S-transferase